MRDRSYQQLQLMRTIFFALTCVSVAAEFILMIIYATNGEYAKQVSGWVAIVILVGLAIIVGTILIYVIIRCVLNYFILKRKEDVAHLPQYKTLKDEWNKEDKE